MSAKIIVDETEPLIDVPDPPYKSGDVVIRKGKRAAEHYHILDFLGRGKFGEVKRCQERTSGREYAAKLIAVSSTQERKDVIHEIDIMKKLHHRRVIQLYDAFDAKDETCLIMEVIHGGELFDRVICDDFVLSEKACVCFVRQICEGLEYMHTKNIIHLDMKPENVMCLSRKGNRIKIIDFGLAREYVPKKDMRVLFGTPEFMAPEVIQYEPIHYTTDMWSVGVICYVLLSGLSPFMGDTDGETLTNVIKGDFDFDYAEFDDISDDALDLIERLLIKDKSKRLSAEQCLEHPWLRRTCSEVNMDKTQARLRHYVYRRKWQKVVNAIIALKRMGVNLDSGHPATRSVVKTSQHRPVVSVPKVAKDDSAAIARVQPSGPSVLSRYKSLPDVTQDVRNGFVIKSTHGSLFHNKWNRPSELKTHLEYPETQERNPTSNPSNSKSPVVEKNMNHLGLDWGLRPHGHDNANNKKRDVATPEKTSKLIWDSVSDDDAGSSIADDLAVDLFIAESDEERPPLKQTTKNKKREGDGKLKSLISNFDFKDDDPDGENPRRKCDSGYSEDSKSLTDSESQDAEQVTCDMTITVTPSSETQCMFGANSSAPTIPEENRDFNQRQQYNQRGRWGEPFTKKGPLKKKELAAVLGPNKNPTGSKWPTSPTSPTAHNPGAYPPGKRWPRVGGTNTDTDSSAAPRSRRKELSFPAANAAMDKLRTNQSGVGPCRFSAQDNAARNKKSSDTKKAKPTYYIKLPNGGAGVKALADLFNSKS